MLRGLLFLIVLGLVAYLILTLMRRVSRGRESPAPAPQPVQTKPVATAALPAPGGAARSADRSRRFRARCQRP